MRDDDIRNLHVGDEVVLRGTVTRNTIEKCLVSFPEINTSVWVWERNVHQPFFVRSCPPAVSSYAAIRHECDRLKADNERLKVQNEILFKYDLNLRKCVQNREEIRQKVEEGLHECLHLMEGLSRVAAWHIAGLLRDKVSTSDTLIDLVSQARDIAWKLQGIWEAVSERQTPTA